MRILQWVILTGGLYFGGIFVPVISIDVTIISHQNIPQYVEVPPYIKARQII